MYWASTIGEAETPEEVVEAADAILAATRQMTAVLSTIDDLAALDRGTLVVDPSPFDLGALVHQVGDELARSSRRDVVVEVPDGTTVVADRARIEQVLGRFWCTEIARHDRRRLSFAVWSVLSQRLMRDALPNPDIAQPVS
jgi:hypothetical protein